MFRTSIEQAATADGRASARRLFVGAAVVVFIATAAVVDAGNRGPAEPPVTVTEERGVYRVAATFAVAAPTSAVIAALTDYPRIPRFMPEVQTSNVLARGPAHAVVEQEAVSRFMLFSKRVHLVLTVEEGEDAIRFRDRCGKSFERYEGEWTFEPHDSITVVTYRLAADPRFEVPEFLLKRLLKRDSTQMIERLKAEIAARAK